MQAVLNFVIAHQVLLASLGVAILDLIFALIPSVASNGILHALYLALSKDKAAAAPQA